VKPLHRLSRPERAARYEALPEEVRRFVAWACFRRLSAKVADERLEQVFGPLVASEVRAIRQGLAEPRGAAS
jgi:hypothetical protein